MKLRWPWNRKPSLSEQFVAWVTQSQEVLDKYDPLEAAKFRDLMRSFITAHKDDPPTPDETWWVIERGLSLLKRSMDRLDVDLPEPLA